MPKNPDIKLQKNYREHFYPKTVSYHMKEVFHRLLVNSDPFISSLSQMYSETGKRLSVEAFFE